MRSDEPAWTFRLRHVLEAIAESRQFVAGMSYEAFCNDPRTVKAEVWNVAMIGEAVRHVPDGVQAAHPGIPWAAMRGMRNHIVHGYDMIDLEIVWGVVTDELPPLVPLLAGILDDPMS